LAASYRGRGIKLLFNDFVTKLEAERVPAVLGQATDSTIRVTTNLGGQLVADQVLMAFGRTPNSDHLGLHDAGVSLSEDGAILVDANSRTNVPSIYAVGDVTNRFNLTPVAIREGHAFADSVFGGRPWQVDYDLVPTAVFSSPEVGAAGLTEAQAREQFPVVDIYMTKFMSLKAIAAGSQQPTLLKLIVDAESMRIVGIHLFAEDASEMIQAFAVALRSGATISDFMTTMAVHPTLGEELVTFQMPTVRYDRRGDAKISP
jgi:glutathione reductase (NADPH)